MRMYGNLGRAAATAAAAWFIAAGSAPAEAEMPLLIDETLMADSANQDADSPATYVAVDGSGQWLRLRADATPRGRDEAGMEDVLQFAAVDFDVKLVSARRLTASDYRSERDAWLGSRIWGYMSEPVDTPNAAKPSDRTAQPEGRRRADRRSSYAPSPRQRYSHPVRTEPTEVRKPEIKVNEFLFRGPRYVLDAIKFLYSGTYALLIGIAMIVGMFGLAAAMDVMARTRRA